MENDNYDSQFDRGIEECNSDILKAAGQENMSSQSQKSKPVLHVMPAFEDILKNKAAHIYPPVRNIGKEFVSQMVEKISNSQQQDRSGEMPSLDLGQQILAQQRKVAALKRKSPSSPNGKAKTSSQVQLSATHIDFMSQAPASPQHRIIADIVAKEILILSSAR